MANVYLSVEAVNLGNLIQDTEDLSTIRGSGLMILDLEGPTRRAIDNWRQNVSIELVTAGASQTVIRVQLNDDDTSDALVRHVSEFLRRDELLRYATIVVDCAIGDYDVAREALLAKNRWRQLQQSRVSIADAFLRAKERDTPENAEQQRTPWCPIDMVRPAVRLVDNVRNDEKRFVSNSVARRRAYGFSEKQDFYYRTAQWRPTAQTIGDRLRAAWQFQQIAEFDRDGDGRPAKDYRELPANLNGKIAIFYVDGNEFGKKQMKLCINEARQRQWDGRVQGEKLAALKNVLLQMWDPAIPEQLGPAWWNQSNRDEWRFRFETLLWGGDELMWVVPAWQGWNVANSFFETVRKLQPAEMSASPNRSDTMPRRLSPGATHSPFPSGKSGIRNLDAKPSKAQIEMARQKQEALEARSREAKAAAANQAADIGQLSYSAGLVFCHAEAPIQRIWQLAKELADEAKEATPSNGREDEKNRIAYAVLESFDQFGHSIKAARVRHLPFPPADDRAVAQARIRRSVLHADQLAELQLLIPWMRTHFPRGAVYKLLDILRYEDSAGTADSEFSHWYERAVREIHAPSKDSMLHEFGHQAVTDKHPLSETHRMNWLHLAELWDYVV